MSGAARDPDAAPAQRAGHPVAPDGTAMVDGNSDIDGTADIDDAEAAVLGTEAAVAALERGPRGALVISVVAVSLLFAGWLLFYFCLFLKRGAVG